MSFKNKNILITGVSGFVGSHMAKHLLNKGANVFGLVRRRADGSIPQNIRFLDLESSIGLLEGDIRDISSVASALEQSNPYLIFHFAAQSFIPSSFVSPNEVMDVNCMGTANLLEAIRSKDLDPVIVFAGSSEEYGLAFVSDSQYMRALRKYGTVFPPPISIPELPITESSPLRPMSPYAVSKVYGDYLMRNYHICYGLKTVISRSFNNEGVGRGKMFVTSTITRQVMQMKRGEIGAIVVGNVNAFRDWSHVNDIVEGYCLLAQKGIYGDVYNQGSQRTNSIMSYALFSLECAGYKIKAIQTIKGDKLVDNPTEIDNSEMFGLRFIKTKIDKLLIDDKLEFKPSDLGIVATTNKGKVKIIFDAERFRAAEVPILLTSTAKIRQLGFKTRYSLKDIINDQLNYYSDPDR
jgi:GDPmannose 4,6-dehydratase